MKRATSATSQQCYSSLLSGRSFATGRARSNFGLESAHASTSSLPPHLPCRRYLSSVAGGNRDRRNQRPLWAGGVKGKTRNATAFLVACKPVAIGATKRTHGSHSHGPEGFEWVKKLIRKFKGEEEEECHDQEKNIDKKFHNYKLEAKEAKNQEKQIKNVTYLGLGLNVGLGGAKYLAGVFGNSEAMVADAVHSFTDVISDVVTLWALHMSALPHDPQYPYGRGKFETVGTFLVAMTLVGTGVGIGGHSFDALLHISSEIPTQLALWGAVGSIVLKELLYQVTVRIGKRANSNLVVANAWHHRTDAISSVVALLGIVGAQFGFAYLDPMAGMAVAAMIIKMGVDMGWESIQELTDASLDKEMLAYMGSLISKVDGIVEYRNIRARKMGTYQIVDVEIQVDPLVSVSVAHQLAQRVRLTLLDAIPQINDVLVHVDPEPPIEDTLETLMRPQSEITADVAQKVAMFSDEVAGMSFLCCHYYNHRLTVEVDIVLKDNKTSIQEAQRIARKVQKEIMKIPDIDYADVMMNLSLLERGGPLVFADGRKGKDATAAISGAPSEETTNLTWLGPRTAEGEALPAGAAGGQQQPAQPIPHHREFVKGRRPRLYKTNNK